MRCAVLIFLLCATSLVAQPKPDTVQQRLQGRVRSMRIEVVDSGSTEPRPESDQTFDENGWVTESTQYMPDGQVRDHSIFKRSGPRMIEADTTRYIPSELAERTVTTFEEHGFPIQMSRYSLDGMLKERIVTDYEETQIVERHYDGNEKLIQTRTISTLHDPESPDRHVEQKVNGRPEVITDIHKSAGVTEVHQQAMTRQGKVEEKSIRQIDDSGARGATIKTDGSSTTYAVSKDCHDVHFSGNPAGGLHQRCDDAGRLVEEVSDGPGPQSVTRFTYDTDDHGNWTRRYAESFRDGNSQGKSTMIREITYY